MEKERDGRRERERDEKWINNIENVQHELKSNGENLYMHFSFFRKLISTHKTKMFELSWISRFSLRPRPHRNRIVYDESYSYALCSSCHGEKKIIDRVASVLLWEWRNGSRSFSFDDWMSRKSIQFILHVICVYYINYICSGNRVGGHSSNFT